MIEPSTRRRLLRAVAGGGAVVGSGAFAGCFGSPAESTTEPTGGGATTTPTETSTTASSTEQSSTRASTTDGPTGTTNGERSGTRPETGAGGSLDLREANVVGVGVSETDSGVRFDVTLYHDDDGEEGYADWWVVETLEGTELGRRALAHPHCTCEFTRSATVEIPAGTACVVVRGHDQTHGYGGRVAIVTFEPSDVSFVDQGPESTSFADADCP